jgi:hypothetical protein
MSTSSLRFDDSADNVEQRFLQAIYGPARKRSFRKLDIGKGKRPAWDPGDCQVRALCTATGMRYEEAWDTLYRLQGKHRTAGFNLTAYLDRDGEALGVLRRLSFPAVKGQPRMTADEFCQKYPRGNFILRMPHHVAAVEDGVLLDCWNSSFCCVYTAWEVREKKPS